MTHRNSQIGEGEEEEVGKGRLTTRYSIGAAVAPLKYKGYKYKEKQIQEQQIQIVKYRRSRRRW